MGEGGEPRERAGCVVGIAFGLLVLVGSIAGLLGSGVLQLVGGGIDGAERVADLFREGRPPFELELVETASMQGVEMFLRLERPGAAAPAEETRGVSGEPDAAAKEPGAAVSSESTPVEPCEVVLLQHGSMAAAAALFRAPEGDGSRRGSRREREEASRGASARLIKWEKDPSFAWHTTIERDEIQWSRWRADLLVERSFREGGGWRDSVRVNLSQPGRPLVLFAQWPDETPVDRGVLRHLLRSIRMLETEDDA